MSSVTPHLASPRSRSRQRRTFNILRTIVAVIAIVFALFPVVWIISASFNPLNSLSAQNLIPRNATLDNYRTLFNDPLHPFPQWMLNSLKVSILSATIGVVVTAFSAFAFSRFRFKGRRNLLLGILLLQVFPNMLAMVSIFLLLQQIGNYIPGLGLNTHGGLILVYLGGALGANTWMMKGFFDSIPRELDESAKIDGASQWQVFWRIIFPLVRPVLAVVTLLSFIGSYGEVVLSKVLLQSSSQYTLAVGLWLFISGQYTERWGVFAAGALLASLPIVILYFFLQDQIVSGLTSGAVKG